MFTIECDGIFWVEVENEVYSIYNRKTRAHRFFDANGNSLPDYQRPPRNDGSNDDYIDDYIEEETDLIFNQYGIACGDHCLVDKDGNGIPNTELNLEADWGRYDRYFSFSFISEEQSKSIDVCGTADGITLDIYDTKTKRYVVKGIPEFRLDVSFYDGEPDVILAAIDLIPEYEEVDECRMGTIIGKKNGTVTVYNYYG